MSINKRLSALILAKETTANALSIVLGFSRNLLTNIVEKKTNPSYEVLVALHKHFPDINMMWLLFEEGEMFNTENLNELDFLRKENVLLNDNNTLLKQLLETKS